MSEPDPLNATLAQRRDLSERLTLLWVVPDGGVADFTAGQFIQLGWPKPPDPEAEAGARLRWIKRSYSIGSAPREKSAYELCIAQVGDGLLTPKLWTLTEGARLWCDNAPKGHFTLERIPHGLDLLMIATGTGIAPYISMLRQYRGTDRWRRLAIVHGVREESDLAYDAELRAVEREDTSVRYAPILSRASDSNTWMGLHGRVQSILEDEVCARACGFALDPASTRVFLCGNPDMINDVRALLATRGFTLDTAKAPGNLHFERYW